MLRAPPLFFLRRCPETPTLRPQKANFACDLGQNIVSTYVTTFGEIGPEEGFRKIILMIPLFGPPQQPMAGQRIGRHKNLVVVKLNSDTLPGRGHFSIQGEGPFPTAEFPGPVGLAIHALNRHGGIELERAPNGLGHELLLEKLKTCLHSTLTDVAPRADEVRVDFDIHCFHKWRFGIGGIESGYPAALPLRSSSLPSAS
jgi:hypothetical protein